MILLDMLDQLENQLGHIYIYEVIYQNKQINPMKMKLPSGKILKDGELKNSMKK